jgi:hypothetical protein
VSHDRKIYHDLVALQGSQEIPLQLEKILLEGTRRKAFSSDLRSGAKPAQLPGSFVHTDKAEVRPSILEIYSWSLPCELTSVPHDPERNEVQ